VRGVGDGWERGTPHLRKEMWHPAHNVYATIQTVRR
jgi:hypothetical protein